MCIHSSTLLRVRRAQKPRIYKHEGDHSSLRSKEEIRGWGSHVQFMEWEFKMKMVNVIGKAQVLGMAWRRPRIVGSINFSSPQAFRPRETSSGIADPGPMDSPVLTQLFRQLFSHRASRCLARRAPAGFLTARHAPIQHRSMATRRMEGETKNESNWVPRQHTYPAEKAEEIDRYPVVTADMLRKRAQRPKRVKMLLRDFIEGGTDTIWLQEAWTDQLTFL